MKVEIKKYDVYEHSYELKESDIELMVGHSIELHYSGTKISRSSRPLQYEVEGILFDNLIKEYPTGEIRLVSNKWNFPVLNIVFQIMVK